MSRNGHEDIAARLRDEAPATAPERLRADVMLRVHAEPRPRRVRPRRSFGRSFATVAAAACIVAALAFGLSRVDLGSGTGGAGAGGGTAAAGKALSPAPGALGAGETSATAPPTSTPEPHKVGSTYGAQDARQARPSASRKLAVPRPLRAAVLPRSRLAPPLRHAFGALDPYGPGGR